MGTFLTLGCKSKERGIPKMLSISETGRAQRLEFKYIYVSSVSFILISHGTVINIFEFESLCVKQTQIRPLFCLQVTVSHPTILLITILKTGFRIF